MASLMISRHLIIRISIGVAAFFLLTQLFYLQIWEQSYQRRAMATTVDEVTLYPSRGLVRDRDSNFLIYNKPMYDLLAVYDNIDHARMDTTRFCRLLGISEAEYIKGLSKDWESPRFSKSVPFVFKSKIPDTIYTRFQEFMHEFPGFITSLRSVRGYPHANASHLVGTIREVNPSEVEKDPFYASGDYIGASGLEYQYEKELRGVKGIRYVLKDNLGREVADFRPEESRPASLGAEIMSTISLELQQYGETLMQNKIGSIVAIEPKTGEVLAMISSPGFNPNNLTISTQRTDTYYELLNDPGKPFFDRTVMAQYPPGSLFKPLVGLIALQENVIPENFAVKCAGGYAFKGRILTGCHGHPPCRNVSEAIQHSCNAYFVTVFRRIVDQHGFYEAEKGLTDFNKYLQDFGLGSPLGIDFPNEKAGNIPTSDYYNKWYRDQRWNSIWLRSLGIGQGEILMTNLQMANMAAAIANRGVYKTPHLVSRINGELVDAEYLEFQKTGIDAPHFEPIIHGMELAVNAGTARMAYIPDIRLCGKTGTAENPHGKDHSIFFGFAPRENPQIAVAVYVENAGFGGTYAAPIASLVMEKWIRNMGKIHPSRKWIEDRMLEADLITKP